VKHNTWQNELAAFRSMMGGFRRASDSGFTGMQLHIKLQCTQGEEVVAEFEGTWHQLFKENWDKGRCLHKILRDATTTTSGTFYVTDGMGNKNPVKGEFTFKGHR
jgi:hypothetical protein